MTDILTPACYAVVMMLIGIDSAWGLMSIISLIFHTWNFFLQRGIQTKTLTGHLQTSVLIILELCSTVQTMYAIK